MPNHHCRPRQAHPARSRGTAVLIDFENITYAGQERLTPNEVTHHLGRVLRAAGDADYTLAVAPRRVLQDHGLALTTHGLRWLMCEAGPDAADREICLIALDLIERGYTDVTIVSGDHYFAQLEPVTNLRIIAPRYVQVARVLQPLTTPGV